MSRTLEQFKEMLDPVFDEYFNSIEAAYLRYGKRIAELPQNISEMELELVKARVYNMQEKLKALESGVHLADFVGGDTNN